MKKILIYTICIILGSCNSKSEMKSTNESPLTVVIKLNSAESTGNIDEAKKYIDLKSVYKEHISDGEDYNEIYAKQIRFKSSSNGSQKFTNQFKYYDFKISEYTQEKKAKVNFLSMNNNAKIKEIIYYLDKRNENWKIVKIDYINN